MFGAQLRARSRTSNVNVAPQFLLLKRATRTMISWSTPRFRALLDIERRMTNAIPPNVEKSISSSQNAMWTSPTMRGRTPMEGWNKGVGRSAAQSRLRKGELPTAMYLSTSVLTSFKKRVHSDEDRVTNGGCG